MMEGVAMKVNYIQESKLSISHAKQDFFRTREVGEFLSGALAGAMTKAILAPLETIRFCLLCSWIWKYDSADALSF